MLYRTTIPDPDVKTDSNRIVKDVCGMLTILNQDSVVNKANGEDCPGCFAGN